MKKFRKLIKNIAIISLVLSLSLISIICVIEYCDDTDKDISICHDDSGVWDYNEHRCRFDCLTWNDTDGCVKEGNLSEFTK